VALSHPWSRSSGDKQVSGLVGKAARLERLFQASVFPQQIGCALGPDTCRAREPVRGVAAQGDEVRHLLGIDAIALADFLRTDTRRLSRAQGIEDRRALRGELECVAVAARDKRNAAALLFAATARPESSA
jgi:hypothetical protein